MALITPSLHLRVNELGWQLPWVVPDYPTVTLNYLFLMGNVVTQIQVNVKK